MAHSDDKPESTEPVVKGNKAKDITSGNNDDGKGDKSPNTQEIKGTKESSKEKNKFKSKSRPTVKHDNTSPNYEKNCSKEGTYSSKREKASSSTDHSKENEQKEKKEKLVSENKKLNNSEGESSSSGEENSKLAPRHPSKATGHSSERNSRKTRKQHRRRSRGSGSSSPFRSSSTSNSSSSSSSSSSDVESSANSDSESNESQSEKRKKKQKVDTQTSHSPQGKLSRKKYSSHNKERTHENAKSESDEMFKEREMETIPAAESSDVARLKENEDISSQPMDGDWKSQPEQEEEENKKYLKPGTRKLSISSSRRKNKQEDSSGDQKSPKKRRWGSSTTSLPKVSLSISTDSLKNLIPDYKPVMAVLTEVEDLISATAPDDSPPLKKERPFVPAEEDKQEDHEVTEAGESSPVKAPQLEGSNVASPSHNPPSCIIHIKNLVRPFTLQQLKDLLSQTGTLVEKGFWIDKIKSKCYVTYETEEQAVRTRDLLHNARWPVSNPKTLIVDFATQEELDYHKDLSSQPPKVPPPNLDKGNNRSQFGLEEVSHRRREEREDRRREKGKREEISAPPIREWDKDKVAQESPEREHRQKNRNEKEKPRSAEKKKDKKDSKRKQEEETPAKLLDGLFRKTKTTPCIYWLPLTEEQIQQRKQRKEELRQKRMQEKKEQEEAERSQRQKGKDSRGREKETSRRSQSRSPVGRRR